MKQKRDNSGITFIEVMLIVAIIMIIALPILRIIYGNEIREIESQFFDIIRVGEIGKFLILGILTFLALFFKFRPEYLKAKKENRPVIGRPVFYFALVSLVTVALLLFFQR